MEDEFLDLLANQRLIKKYTKIDEETHNNIKTDDNDEIMKLLKERLELGKKRYGHGVRVNQNTQDFGTQEDDWELMALEEMLDGLIYTTASIIRYRRKKKDQDSDIPNQDSKKINILKQDSTIPNQDSKKINIVKQDSNIPNQDSKKVNILKEDSKMWG